MVVFLFYSTAFVIVLTAVYMLRTPSPVRAALSLMLIMFVLGFIYMLLLQEFFAAIQLLVYAGAIVVLFLFIIMLLNLTTDGVKELSRTKIWRNRINNTLGIFIAAALAIQFIPIVTKKLPTPQLPASATEMKQIGRWIFGEYLLAFEALALVLMVALIGIVIIAKRQPK